MASWHVSKTLAGLEAVTKKLQGENAKCSSARAYCDNLLENHPAHSNLFNADTQNVRDPDFASTNFKTQEDDKKPSYITEKK